MLTSNKDAAYYRRQRGGGSWAAWVILLAVPAGFLLILGGAVSWHWYAAGQQARVWQAEGATITQWQVFVGVKPLTRSLIHAP